MENEKMLRAYLDVDESDDYFTTYVGVIFAGTFYGLKLSHTEDHLISEDQVIKVSKKYLKKVRVSDPFGKTKYPTYSITTDDSEQDERISVMSAKDMEASLQDAVLQSSEGHFANLKQAIAKASN